MFISVTSSSSHVFFSHICQRHVSVAALSVPGLTPRRLPSSPHVFGFIEGDPNSIRGSCLKGKPGDTPGRITDAWAQGEASPQWALAWGERWGMSLGAEVTMASARDPAEPGAGRPGKGRGGRGSTTPQSTGHTWGLAEVHPVFPGTHPLLAHGPRTHSQSLCDWRQAPAAPAYLANIHPGPQQNAKQRSYYWMAIVEYHHLRHGLTAFVRLGLLQCLGHRWRFECCFHRSRHRQLKRACTPSPSGLPHPSARSCPVVDVREKTR